MEYQHTTVLQNEAVSMLNVRANGTYIDATLGGGGHFSAILRRLEKGGTLVGIDQDEAAIQHAKQLFEKPQPKIIFVHDNFKNIGKIIENADLKPPDGVVMDLGVSSYQLDNPERGFSYMQDAPLDMRMDRSTGKTAYDVVNTYSEQQLSKLIFDYGEERYARSIAAHIVKRRQKQPIETTLELADLVKASMPPQSKKGGHHPAKRTFQAIRIEVNDELGALSTALTDAFDKLAPGGRIAVITFHSLEDRIVKTRFAEWARGCICPPKLPVCVCGHKPQATVLTKKPIVPSAEEIEKNPRARSAKLRAVEKIKTPAL